MLELRTVSRRLRTARVTTLALALLGVVVPAATVRALTPPMGGAVALPAGADMRAPIPTGYSVRVTAPYGPGVSSFHDGTSGGTSANDYYALDFVYVGQPDGGRGLPIVAPLAGTVVRSGWATIGWASYGQRVILRHDLGDGHVYHTLFAHLNAIDPAIVEGGQVAQGQVLGELGGSSNGSLSGFAPHLHFAMHQDSDIGGSGTGGSYGGNSVVPEPFDGVEDLALGSVLDSTNNGRVECGDGHCNGGETNASCSEDCPKCESIPAAGRAVDDSEVCFSTGGTAGYWHQEGVGMGGRLWWTMTTATGPVDNHGTWGLAFDAAGMYLLEAYTAQPFAQSQQANYQIRHGGDVTSARIDQSAVDGWNGIGTYFFAAGGDQWVRLDDVTGEGDAHKIVFDAIRLSPADGTVPPGPDAGPAGPGDGGLPPGLRGPVTGRELTGAGCGCAVVGGGWPSGRGLPLLLAVGVVGVFVTRRRRRR